MKVKIKRLHPLSKIPKYAHSTDAGLDLTAINYHIDENQCHVFGTGLSIEIPKGYVGLLFPRSSNAKKEVLLSNSVGVIDSGYRGEIILKYRDLHLGVCKEPYYKVGDRVGQLIIIPYPSIEFEEVEELSESPRGNNGYGSTGR